MRRTSVRVDYSLLDLARCVQLVRCGAEWVRKGHEPGAVSVPGTTRTPESCAFTVWATTRRNAASAGSGRLVWRKVSEKQSVSAPHLNGPLHTLLAYKRGAHIHHVRYALHPLIVCPFVHPVHHHGESERWKRLLPRIGNCTATQRVTNTTEHTLYASYISLS